MAAILRKWLWKIYVFLHIFRSNRGSESARFPDFDHGNTLDMLAYAEAPPPPPKKK